MYKLKDIIKSGGGNAKINRFINKYILSKDEKKDVIKEIKNSKGGSSDSLYFMTINKNMTEDIQNALGSVIFVVLTVSYASSGTEGYTYVINMPYSAILFGLMPNPNGYMCYKISLGHKEVYGSHDDYIKIPINADINNKEDLFSFLSYVSNADINIFKENLIEITEEQFFDKDWLLNKANEL